jgi:uncharacterized protein (DUF488 family)
MKLYTIGFTKSSAEHFFGRLRAARVRRLIDVRLNNASQLAGFAKRDDLAWFSRELCGVDTAHAPELAPTAELLGAYRRGELDWDGYAAGFATLIAGRRIEALDPAGFDGACLLCSEASPHHCHRRLVAEHLAAAWPGVEIVHL